MREIIKRVGGQVYKFSRKYKIWWNSDLSPECPLNDSDIPIKRNGRIRTDKERRRQHKWYLENRERIIERQKKYNNEHREEISLRQISYRKKVKARKNLTGKMIRV